MSKRGDCIHKRKDGRWEGRYQKARDGGGNIKYGSVYGKSYRETKEKLMAVLADKQTQLSKKHQEITFSDVLHLWMRNNALRLKGGTIHKYTNLIRTHIEPGLGFIRIHQLNAETINRFLSEKLLSGRADRRGGLSASYVRSMAVVINAAIEYAVRERLCDPLKTPICKPVPSRSEPSFLDTVEQQQLEIFLLDNPNLTKIGIFISLHTGLRIGEICALSWKDVDLNQKIIRVRHTVARIRNPDGFFDSATALIIDTPKTRSSVRDIPISSRLLPMLLEAKKLSQGKFVISETETFLPPRIYDYRSRKVLQECLLKPINYHALRHTFATRCIESGVDIKSLSEILGHGSASVTMNIYVHSSIELKRCQLEKLCDYLS